MSSDELDKKSADENTKENTSSGEETEGKDDVKEEKVNSKPAAKKKGADPPKIKQPAKKRVKTEQAEKEIKKEEKKAKDKKVEEEEDEEDESAEENDVENHKAVPLLDQPLEITGSRKRKEVQRFKPAATEEEHKETKIPEGKGKALGDIERINFNIQRAKPEDLKLLHKLCFGKPGKAATLKKAMKQFNGFEFEEASDDYEKKKITIEKSFKKVTIAHLKNICNILDLEKSGTKDDILDRILSFLTCPVDSGKPLPGGKRSRRTGASSKNYDEGEEKFTAKKKTKGKKKDEDTGTEESENEKDESEEEEVKQNDTKKDDAQTTEESAPEEEEKEEKPKKGAKKGKKATEAADKKAPPKKRAAAKKVVEKKSDSEGGGDEDSEEEEPLAKKGKTPPTDEEIKTYVKSLLEGANLELITMKKVCQDVYAHYPDFDLGHKKEFIKTTVKSLISS